MIMIPISSISVVYSVLTESVNVYTSFVSNGPGACFVVQYYGAIC